MAVIQGQNLVVIGWLPADRGQIMKKLTRAQRLGAAFRKALNETGYIEGQNVMVTYHWDGHQRARQGFSIYDAAAGRPAPITL
jgi:hypothetical protein